MIEHVPLIFDGDGYSLGVTVQSDKLLSLVVIDRYPDNENRSPTRESWQDLSPHVRTVIIAQLRHRFPNKTISIK